MEGTVSECLQTGRIYSWVWRNHGHNVEGRGGDADQLSLNPLICMFLKLLKVRPLHCAVILAPGAGR